MRSCVGACMRACLRAYPVNMWISPATWCFCVKLGNPLYEGLDPCTGNSM